MIMKITTWWVIPRMTGRLVDLAAVFIVDQQVERTIFQIQVHALG